MRLFSLPNLTASQVEKTEPWKIEYQIPDFQGDSVAEQARNYKKWATKPTTQYGAHSTAEGVDPNRRVSSQNPMRYLHGISADWDVELDDEEYEKAISKLIDGEHPVNYVSRSFSGGIHAVWFFEEAIYIHGGNWKDRFLKRIAKELKLEKMVAGFDMGNFKRQHYLLHGFDWRPVSKDSRLDISLLNYWMFEESKSADFKDGAAPAIPLDKVKEEVDKVWPDNAWPGEFIEGARGPTYWDPGGDHRSVDSAVVRETGMQVFNMPKGFYTWSEIVGARFVREYEVGRIGAAIKSYWYDGRNYFIQEEGGGFFMTGKDDCLLDLECQHDLNARPGRNENVSEARRGLNQIQKTKKVEAGLPFCFVRDPIVHYENKRYFNTAQVRPLTPDENKFEWGEGFETIASWMEHMLGEDQLKYELAWLTHAYQNALAGKPKRGHAHFLVGPPNCGKTLYNTVVLGGLFGGGIKASDYLTGKSEWTDHLFEYGMWLVDDEAPTASSAMHTAFTARLKEHIANDTFLINGKFKKSGRVFWRGRISCTLNDDPVSMRLLPDLDMSIKDKLMVFNCNDGFNFTKDIKKKVVSELPAFASWLKANVLEEEMLDVRFGVQAYINPILEERSRADSRYAHIIELMNMFKRTLKDDSWEGTSTELMVILNANENNRILLKELSARKLGWGLNHMVSKGFNWINRSEKVQYGWKIG
jgi:hypothetical protein